MKKVIPFLLSMIVFSALGQQSIDLNFQHEGKTVFGTLSKPNETGKFPLIIITPGSGANDRNGTLPMLGANAACLYPDLLNDTLKPYKDLAEALTDSGYAVFRYDKLEYTYPNNLGAISFKKLWLPVESAINFLKTRNDVDTNRIILIGHSEGSTLIPFIARKRNDIKAMISIAGARTPFDSILANQIVNITQTCGGDLGQAQNQANQILTYFNNIRIGNWNGSTPALFGVPANVWRDYFNVNDSVSINYNINAIPTLFAGMELDINVPISELLRFQNEVNITNDFWAIPNLNHYMTENNYPKVSKMLTDTIVYWLRKQNLATQIKVKSQEDLFDIFPNPTNGDIQINIRNKDFENWNISIKNMQGMEVLARSFHSNSFNDISLYHLLNGLYLVQINLGEIIISKKLIKME